MTPDEEILQSRMETIKIVFNRLMNGLSVLPPYDAVQFTTPLVDILVSATMQLENYKEEKVVDTIIDSALKSKP